VPKAQKLVLNQPLTVYTSHNIREILNSKEITLIVLEITALIATLAEISYVMIANQCNYKKHNQSSRGHLRPGSPCH
jgi:hypothetical protein